MQMVYCWAANMLQNAQKHAVLNICKRLTSSRVLLPVHTIRRMSWSATPLLIRCSSPSGCRDPLAPLCAKGRG